MGFGAHGPMKNTSGNPAVNRWETTSRILGDSWIIVSVAASRIAVVKPILHISLEVDKPEEIVCLASQAFETL